MELTPLNPKIESHLAEAQKILDRNPAVRKKLWAKFILSGVFVITILVLYVFFKNDGLQKLPENVLDVLNVLIVGRMWLGFYTGEGVGIFLIGFNWLIGRDMSIKVSRLSNKLYDSCHEINPDKTATMLSEREKRAIANIKFSRGLEPLLMLLGLSIVGVFIYIQSKINSSESINYLPDTITNLGMIQRLSMAAGLFVGLLWVMSVYMFPISVSELFLVHKSVSILLLKLRKLEREILEEQSA